MISKVLEGISQDSVKRLTFILLIDNKIEISGLVTDRYFEIKNKNGPESKIIPFQFRVGNLLLNTEDYDRMFSLNPSDSVFIHFKYRPTINNYEQTTEYRKQIPTNWINDQYIALMVYNYYDVESRRKYALGKGGYGIEIRVPGFGSIIAQNAPPKRKGRR